MIYKSDSKKIKYSDESEEGESVILKKEKSSLSQFVERSLPSEVEVEAFDEIMKKKKRADEDVYDFEDEEEGNENEKDEIPIRIMDTRAHNQEERKFLEEEKEEEIEESLSEIYQDEKGDAVDVSRLEIKKKRGIFFRFLSFLFVLAILAAGIYGAYNYFINTQSDATAVVFTIDGAESVIAGETVEYILYYKNSTKVAVQNAWVEAVYPEDFIFIESSPEPKKEEAQASSTESFQKIKTSIWEIGQIPAYSNGIIKIKGKIIDKQGANSILLAKISYSPENFSSEFKKEASYNTIIRDVGVDIAVDYSSTALVGQSNYIDFEISNQEDSKFNKFLLVIDPRENIKFSPEVAIDKEQSENLALKAVKDNVWEISNIQKSSREFRIKYDIKDKLADKEKITIRFEQTEDGGFTYSFYEKELEVDVMKSDLNITMIINGSKSSQPVNFSDQLNYSIVYSNKGETDMENVIIMAVLESDFLDWTTLKDENNGLEKGNTVAWTKNEIPGLALLEKNHEGSIDFSVNLMEFREVDLGKEYQIKSYAQYSIGSQAEVEQNEDNQSNKILNEINSDLTLTEEIRYFNKDNMPVGTGPLPPKVNETTSFKIYWSLTNNLHELRDTQVELKLPDYVKWDDKKRSSVGTVNYSESERKITWQIGRLPLTVYRADAEFSISITPGLDDQNKILVITPGSEAIATDSKTGASMSVTTAPKTTKLEDDEVANMSSDGRVQ